VLLGRLTCKKIIGLKALNYFNLSSVAPGFCVEHNNSMASKVPESFLSAFSVYNYVNLPNNVFFETSGTYLNTQGYFKKSVKFIRSQKQTKDDWQIIRKLFSYVSKIKFVNNELDNHLISFNNLTSSNYKNFIVFLYFANNFISSKLIFNGNTKISGDFDVFAGVFITYKKKN
jgi:anaerobic selenocysteine-containing dehydrogenase